MSQVNSVNVTKRGRPKTVSQYPALNESFADLVPIRRRDPEQDFKVRCVLSVLSNVAPPAMSCQLRQAFAFGPFKEEDGPLVITDMLNEGLAVLSTVDGELLPAKLPRNPSKGFRENRIWITSHGVRVFCDVLPSLHRIRVLGGVDLSPTLTYAITPMYEPEQPAQLEMQELVQEAPADL